MEGLQREGGPGPPPKLTLSSDWGATQSAGHSGGLLLSFLTGPRVGQRMGRGPEGALN